MAIVYKPESLADRLADEARIFARKPNYCRLGRCAMPQSAQPGTQN